MHWAALGMAILLIPNLVFAVSPVDLTYSVPVVAAIVIAFIAVVKMVAESTSNPQLEAWAKTEIREFVAALILIGLVTAGWVAAGGASATLTGNSNYVSAATTVLDGWLDKYDRCYYQIIVAATKLRNMATYSPYINLPMWYVAMNYSSNPLAGAGMFFVQLTSATQALANAIYLTEAVRLLVVFCGVVVPKVLLPLSLCLRMVPFSRRLGNSMVAISIAGAVLLPFSVIFADALNATLGTGLPNPAISDLSKLDVNPGGMGTASALCESMWLRITFLMPTDLGFSSLACIGPWYGVCQPLLQNVVYPLTTTTFQLIIGVLSVIWEVGLNASEYGTNAYDALYPFLRDVGNLVLLTYMDMIIIGMITVTGARSISGALGGEWYMAGIQRLI